MLVKSREKKDVDRRSFAGRYHLRDDLLNERRNSLHASYMTKARDG